MIVDLYHFFNEYRKHFGKLDQSQVDGLLIILNEAKNHKLTVAQLGYILASAKHESANTFQPIKERRASILQRKLRKTQNRYWPSGYYGRGIIQLTWLKNYKIFSDLLDVDLVKNPDAALDTDVSVKIAFIGMLRGLFTGFSLPTFINPVIINRIAARRVVNGLDKAHEIAEIATKFDACIKEIN